MESLGVFVIYLSACSFILTVSFSAWFYLLDPGSHMTHDNSRVWCGYELFRMMPDSEQFYLAGSV